MKKMCEAQRNDAVREIAIAIVAAQSAQILLHTRQLSEAALARGAIRVAKAFVDEWNNQADAEVSVEADAGALASGGIPADRVVRKEKPAVPVASEKVLRDSSVSVLDIDEDMKGILMEAGVPTIGHILDVENVKASEKGIESLKGIGPKSRKAILEAVEAYKKATAE